MALQDGGMDLATAQARVTTLEAYIGTLTPLEQYLASLKNSPLGRMLEGAKYRVAQLIAYKCSGRVHV